MNCRTKLFFSDMDGTLLTSKRSISSYTKTTIEHIQMSGHKFILCSGRPLSNMIQMQQELQLSFPGQYIIAYNGAVIYDCDKKEIIYQRTLPLSSVADIFKHAREKNVYCHTYQGDQILSTLNGRELDFYRGPIPMDYTICSDPMTLLKTEPYKVMSISLEESSDIKELQKEISQLYGDTICSAFSNPFYLEFFHIEAGKGNAIRFLTEYLGSSRDMTYSFGDQENDITMLLETGTSIAMSNAPSSVKSRASMISHFDNNHDGVAEMLSKFI